MSKIVKCLAGVASMAAVACGAYFVYKNVIAKEEEEDFDFDDSFEEEDEDATREYVSIQITSDAAEEATEEVAEEAPAADETEEAVAEEENVEQEEVTAEE